MKSFISWLDHSEEDQRRVREMLQLFADKDTVDDLGIGTVRDAISNALFPGTSVIQTRARYFLFIPWLFQHAERRQPQLLVAKAEDFERGLIEALRAGGDLAGLIGVDAGKNVRRLPSAIYWNALIRYGIFLVPSLSITQYGRHVARGLAATDIEDEMADRTFSFWQRDIPDAPRDFFRFQAANFNLTRDEAEWLSERMISSEGLGPSSLLTTYLRDIARGNGVREVDAVWDGALPADASPSITQLVHHAQRFSCATRGAALLYNLMLAEARSQGLEATDDTSIDTYRELIGEWIVEAAGIDLADWAAHANDFWDCILGHAVRIPLTTRLFLDGWLAIVSNGVDDIASASSARDLIRAREFQHKKGQARLANKKRLDEWRGYAGTGALTFRWAQVQRLLLDISAGLGRSEEEDDHAVA